MGECILPHFIFMEIGTGNHTKNLTRVKIPLKAKTSEELVQLQITNNIKHNKEFNYTDFRQANSGEWYCWFYATLKSEL